MSTRHVAPPELSALNKVPQVTIYFWIVKILCTTVGESAADFLNINLNFGLTGTSLVTGALLVLVLAIQLRADRYRPVTYWATVALVSVFGTLVTDNLTDSLGVPLEVSTLVFSVLLAVTFAAWYRAEGTLSIHSIVTRRREAFYWLAILVTFALGTASGDLMAEVLGLGYLVAGTIVAVLIATAALAWRLGAHPVLAFWICYILTRPLGASIGDYLTQPAQQGGLGWGATLTSAIFTVGILAIVAYLAISHADATDDVPPPDRSGAERHGLLQTLVAAGLIAALGGIGYAARTSTLHHDVAPAAAPGVIGGPRTGLGDLSSFRRITQDTLNLINAHDQSGATARVTDLETAWDDSEARLKPRDQAAWTDVDTRIDRVLRALRSTHPDASREQMALTDLLNALD